MKPCTYSSMPTGNCRLRATVELSWSRQVKPGWTLRVERVYCDAHAHEVARRIRGEGYQVGIADLVTAFAHASV